MCGLLERDIKYILKAIGDYEEIEEAIVFGSRAMGNYKKGSDVDIALKGPGIHRKTISRLMDDLNEEYPLPYFFDIVHYDAISNQELRKHIDNVGKTIYEMTVSPKNEI